MTPFAAAQAGFNLNPAVQTAEYGKARAAPRKRVAPCWVRRVTLQIDLLSRVSGISRFHLFAAQERSDAPGHSHFPSAPTGFDATATLGAALVSVGTFSSLSEDRTPRPPTPRGEPPAHATLLSVAPAISADGTLTYTPTPKANGSVTVTV